MVDEQEPRADLVVVGGVVVNDDRTTRATVVVRDGIITDLLPAEAPPPPHRRAIDATGMLVVPGGVDLHCHVDEEIAGTYRLLDDYPAASIAALWGGTTTIAGFAIPEGDETPLAAVERAMRGARSSRCSTATHGCVTEWDETTEDQLLQMHRLGVRTIKLFTTYEDDVMADARTIGNVLAFTSRSGGLALVHAEADDVIRSATGQLAGGGGAGAVGIAEFGSSRPESSELLAVARVIDLAARAGSDVYFVHISSPAASDYIASRRRDGEAPIFVETCPHYLVLDERMYARPDAVQWACCPPLRPVESVGELVARAVDGRFDVLASDHCCYSRHQKIAYGTDIEAVPKGLPGVETRMPVAYSRLVRDAGMPPEQFVAMFASNPARIAGLEGKGRIAVGSDADIVVFDPTEDRRVETGRLHMRSDVSPYEGMSLVGWPSTVIAGGRVVVDPEGFHDPGPIGRHLATREPQIHRARSSPPHPTQERATP